MQSSSVTVSAPGRLHFGLLSIGDVTKRQFGGAGLMINAPRTKVDVSPADSFSLRATPELHDTIHSTIQKWQSHLAPKELVDLAIESMPVEVTVEPVPRHSGLGSGTQLAFSIATAMQVAFGQPIPSSEELALAMGRGRRSAIGSYGFHQGGFLVDRGIENESIAPLDMRIDFPFDWDIVLITPSGPDSKGVFGESELDAFRSLPATTQAESDYLTSLLSNHIVPSILEEDFAHFAPAVTEFGYRSGLFYSPIQGGAYATDAAKKIVEIAKAVGTYAIGQSSWGPTIFAISESQKEAWSLVDYLRNHEDDVVCHTSVVAADNRGMTIKQTPPQTS